MYEYHMIQFKVPGGDWEDWMSLPWFGVPGRQAEAMAIARGNEENPGMEYRMVRRSEEVLDDV
jgi:hypothetical protein